MHFANPLNLADVYKVGHHSMYPEGMEFLQSNFTPRQSRVPGVDKVVFFGLQAFLVEVLGEHFGRSFFDRPKIDAIARHRRRVEGVLGMPFDTKHWEDLWDLGFLPLRFSALPEGTEVPLRVPMFVIENTLPDYGWLVNYFESVLSAESWHPMTSATLAVRLRRMLDRWAALTSDTPEFVDWQGHDFSFRGMSGINAGGQSGAGHLLAFAGSDTLVAMDWAEHYYEARGFIGGSVPATEHSVMCIDGCDGELETFRRLLAHYPKGIVSIVSDTWDLWKVLAVILPQLKDEIMAREGKLVIRPDSGNPVHILCGDPDAKADTPQAKGVIELLWDIFGGTINSKGYKVLDPHIGAIYGDSITHAYADDICGRLACKGFASTNVVLGVGSYTYQYVTRDTFGFAMKATWAQVNGESRDIYKDPVTDSGVKKSAKGRLAVLRNAEGELYLVNQATPKQEAQSHLRPVWENGGFLHPRQTYREIAERLGLRKLLPG